MDCGLAHALRAPSLTAVSIDNGKLCLVHRLSTSKQLAYGHHHVAVQVKALPLLRALAPDLEPVQHLMLALAT